MKKSYERTIDDLVDVIKRAKNDKIRVNLLIGAGASVSGGIPLADAIIKDIEKKFPREYAKADEKTYAGYMSVLTSLERRNLISKYVNDAKVNWAHLLIAHLMKNKIINSVLTTNFDNLLVRACAIENCIPGVYDLAASNSFRPELLFENAIIHLHGQYTGFVLCNTDNELEMQIERIEPTFIELNKNSMWIVVGYSGKNDPIVKLFRKYKNSDNRLYWIGYENEEATEDVKVLFEDREKYCYYIKGYNADSFFVDLCRRLDKYPPDIINAPFTYLYNTIDTITEYIEDDIPFLNRESYNNMTKEIVMNAVNDYEHNKITMAEYYFRLNLIDKFKDVMENATEEEKIEIKKITDKNKIEDLVEGALKYLNDLEENRAEYNTKNLALVNVIIGFMNNEDKIKPLSKLLSIIESNEDVDSEVNRVLKIGVLLALSKHKDKKENLEKVLLLLEETNMKENNKEEYLMLKIESLKNLGEYYLETEKNLAVDCFNTIIKIIDENEEHLDNIMLNSIKGEIYIKKIIASEDNFIYIGICLDCFNKVIKNYLNESVEKDNEYILINFIISLYKLIIQFSDKEYSQILERRIKEELKCIQSITIILSYMEAINEITDSVENFEQYTRVVENIYSILSNFDFSNFDDKEKYDASIHLNRIAYYMIENYEDIYSKRILELSNNINENSYNVATLGFYYFRIENNKEEGINYYNKAIKITDNSDLKRAIEQKMRIETTIYYAKLDENQLAELEVDEAIKIGEVSEGWGNLYDEAMQLKLSISCTKELELEEQLV